MKIMKFSEIYKKVSSHINMFICIVMMIKVISNVKI